MHKIKLCSDDFGLNDSVDEAIIKLVEQGRLNAVSCMVVGSTFEKNIARLIAARAVAPIKVEIGIHITLTEYRQLVRSGKNSSIGELLIKSHLGRLEKEQFDQEILAQFNRFKAVAGQRPEFADGHQHAHLLPTICPLFVKYAKANLTENGWARSCWQPFNNIMAAKISTPRALLISQLSNKLRAQADIASLKTNDRFLGVNNFKSDESFATLMQTWLGIASEYSGETLIMCHPGLEKSEQGIYDPIAMRRPDEYEYLSGEQFKKDLEKFGLCLGF